MPNYFSNTLTIKNTCEGFNVIKKIFTPDQFMECSPYRSIIPPPTDLIFSEFTFDYLDSSECLFTKKEKEEKLEYEKNKNAIKFGFESLGFWKAHNWGNTRDAEHVRVAYNKPDSFQALFSSARVPPTTILYQIVDRYPDLAIYCFMYMYEFGAVEWFCNLPGMKHPETGFYDAGAYLESDGEKKVIGSTQFWELTSQFEGAHFDDLFSSPSIT